MNNKFTTVGATIGAVTALLSPSLMAALTGQQVFWLLMVALVCALLGESIIPAFRGVTTVTIEPPAPGVTTTTTTTTETPADAGPKPEP